ncbi:MAG: hypothetical protein NTW54_04270 [Bacteroidetes bacterium]|nr:hypothetical protein [Bacteroidota bacterium]
MKRISLICCTLFICFSFKLFKPRVENVNNLVIFYVENSKGGNSSSLSAEAIDKLDTEIKKNNATPTNKFLLYWSNDAKFDYSKKAENSTKILNGLFEKNSRTPNVWLDKFQMRSLIFEKEFILKGVITVNFFVTEGYLIDYVTRDEPSILMGLFPRELAYITGSDESKVTVNVYYSNKENKLTEEMLKRVNNFTNQSKVTYNYIQVK